MTMQETAADGADVLPVELAVATDEVPIGALGRLRQSGEAVDARATHYSRQSMKSQRVTRFGVVLLFELMNKPHWFGAEVQKLDVVSTSSRCQAVPSGDHRYS